MNSKDVPAAVVIDSPPPCFLSAWAGSSLLSSAPPPSEIPLYNLAGQLHKPHSATRPNRLALCFPQASPSAGGCYLTRCVLSVFKNLVPFCVGKKVTIATLVGLTQQDSLAF